MINASGFFCAEKIPPKRTRRVRVFFAFLRYGSTSKGGNAMTQKSRSPEFFDSGCISLIEAIVKQAARDYLLAARGRKSRRAAARMREAAGFFRSDYFRRLTGTDGDCILDRIRKEAEGK